MVRTRSCWKKECSGSDTMTFDTLSLGCARNLFHIVPTPFPHRVCSVWLLLSRGAKKKEGHDLSPRSGVTSSHCSHPPQWPVMGLTLRWRNLYLVSRPRHTTLSFWSEGQGKPASDTAVTVYPITKWITEREGALFPAVWVKLIELSTCTWIDVANYHLHWPFVS